MPEILEILMLICFGVSWPINARKAWVARTAKGKSPAFLCLILTGYVAGVASKVVNPHFDFSSKWYVLFFYVLNFIMVSVDLAIYFRNKRLDAQREKANV